MCRNMRIMNNLDRLNEELHWAQIASRSGSIEFQVRPELAVRLTSDFNECILFVATEGV